MLSDGPRLVLEVGETRFEVAPGHGARITSLCCAGQELLMLAGGRNFDDALGSTFWPSPQRWPWPPPAALDREPYEVDVATPSLIRLVGPADPVTRLRITKSFAVNLAREAFELTYGLTNTGGQAASWAPWEVTRMPPTGLAFWPTGSAPFGEKPLLTQHAHGHTWCAPAQTAGEGKVFADGAGGYLAYALGGRILVKHFSDVPASEAAPGESEVELYVNADRSYVEVENQGAYASIAPAETAAWRVTWYARKLPSSVTATGPHADLVAFVTQTLQ